MRFPRDMAKTTVTIYSFYYVDNDPQKPSYKRTFIHDCLWSQSSSINYKKTGIANSDTIVISMPYDYTYQSVQNGEDYDGDGWTLNIGPEFVGSYIVKGECEYEFPTYEYEPGQSTDGSEDIIEGINPVLYQRTDFLRNHVEPFEKNYKFKKPKEINEFFIGSRNLWYVEVMC